MKRNIDGFPELDLYDFTEECGNMLSLEPCDYLNMDCCKCFTLEEPTTHLGSYEIVFDVNNERFYCYIVATNIVEALGIFFMIHPHVAYSHIVEHMEV